MRLALMNISELAEHATSSTGKDVVIKRKLNINIVRSARRQWSERRSVLNGFESRLVSDCYTG